MTARSWSVASLLPVALAAGCGGGAECGDDAFVRELLAQPHREARAWIRESSAADVRTLGEQSPADSARLVDLVYAADAVDAQVLDIEKGPGFESAAVLVVELPQASEARARLFALEARVAAASGFDSVLDCGERYLFLHGFEHGLDLPPAGSR